MLDIKWRKSYKKDLKKYVKQGNDQDHLSEIISTIADEDTLDEKYRAHKLGGKHIGKWECHIEPDILLMYEIDKENNILILHRLGSHSEIL